MTKQTVAETTATHTAGPWAVVVSSHQREFTHWIERPASEGLDRETVAAILNVNDSEANARLIAAAPDLLKAAKAVVNSAIDPTDGKPFTALRAAIALAEGRS